MPSLPFLTCLLIGSHISSYHFETSYLGGLLVLCYGAYVSIPGGMCRLLVIFIVCIFVFFQFFLPSSFDTVFYELKQIQLHNINIFFFY